MFNAKHISSNWDWIISWRNPSVFILTFLVPSPSISGVLGAGDQSMLGAMQTDRLKAFIWLSWALRWIHCSTAITCRSRSRFSLGRRWSNLRWDHKTHPQTLCRWSLFSQCVRTLPLSLHHCVIKWKKGYNDVCKVLMRERKRQQHIDHDFGSECDVF